MRIIILSWMLFLLVCIEFNQVNEELVQTDHLFYPLKGFFGIFGFWISSVKPIWGKKRKKKVVRHQLKFPTIFFFCISKAMAASKRQIIGSEEQVKLTLAVNAWVWKRSLAYGNIQFWPWCNSAQACELWENDKNDIGLKSDSLCCISQTHGAEF